jgi:uncharacterized protein YdcH (DUF465 family)
LWHHSENENSSNRRGFAMTHVPHELAEEFPNQVEKIHELKTSNAHFAKTMDAYHNVNRTIHRVETDLEPTTDEHAHELKKERLALKDEIQSMLRKHR